MIDDKDNSAQQTATENATPIIEENCDSSMKQDFDNSASAVKKLSDGLLSCYLPNLRACKHLLEEVTKNQDEIIGNLKQENDKFVECDKNYDLDSMMNKARCYQSKLESIKKEMSMLHDRSTKLKKRSHKLLNQKEKEYIQHEAERRQKIEHEQQLIAKPAARPPD